MPLLFFAHALVLSLGQPQSVPRKAAEIWLSSKDIVDAQAVGNTLTLNPKKPGVIFASGLDLAQTSGLAKIVVTSAANAAALRACPKLAEKVFVSDPFRVDVPLAALRGTLKDLGRCGFDDLKLTDALSTALKPDFQASEDRARRQGLRLEQMIWNDGKREGAVTSAAWRKTLGTFAPFYSLQVHEGIKPGQTLLFDVSLFELSRSKAAALGLKLPQSLDLQLSTHDWHTSPLQSFIDLGFEFGESLGLGKILAKPRLRSKPGEKALFQSGGEIPVRNVSISSAQTSWKTYGLILELQPSAESRAGDGEISVDFKLELSEPDPSTMVDGVPAMTVRKLMSRFDLRTDEETLLSTMVQSRSGLARTQPQGLGNIPGLGRLIQDRQDYEHSTELWISIRPSWQESSFSSALKTARAGGL